MPILTTGAKKSGAEAAEAVVTVVEAAVTVVPMVMEEST
jgi:hypothetical protein